MGYRPPVEQPIVSLGGTGIGTLGGSLLSKDNTGATRNQLDDGTGQMWCSTTIFVGTSIAGYGTKINISSNLVFQASDYVGFASGLTNPNFGIIADGNNGAFTFGQAGDLVSISGNQSATVAGDLYFGTTTGAAVLTELAKLSGTSGSLVLSLAGASVSAPHINATPTTPALPANPPVSGTVYQNTTGGPINIIIPITATLIGGSSQLALGSTNAPANWGGADQIGVSGEVHNVSLRIPNNWFWKVTVASATIGTANVLGE